MRPITFKKATSDHKETIFNWLNEPHIMEFWDNSPEHRMDILNFMEGRQTKSCYFGRDCDFHYWMGFLNEEPYALLMTSEFVFSNCVEENSPYLSYLSQTGKTYGLDFMIGNKNYLGKGLAATTLGAFVLFFQSQFESLADTFIIDPSDDNPRAQHVYAKAGFISMGTCVQEKGHFEGEKIHIMVKKLPIA